MIGTEVELLVAEGAGKKNAATARMSGRARDGRLVHFRPVDTAEPIRPGDIVTVDITEAAPHHLIADSPIRTHRRTTAGDAHERGITPKTEPIGVGLGLPRIGAPAQEPVAASGCATGCGV